MEILNDPPPPGLRMTTELEMMKALNELRAAKAEQAAALYSRSLAAIRLFIPYGSGN